MGLFDDFVKGATDIFNETKNVIKEAQEKAKQNANEIKTTGDDRFDNPPAPLSAIPVQTTLHGQNVQFMISKDFIEHGGYMSSNISLKYNAEEVNFKEDITISLLEGVGDFDEIADCIEEYLASKKVTGVDEFVDFPDGKYLFKAKMEASDYMEYFYVLRNNVTDPYDYDILLLFYPNEVTNTNLEKKLISCFEETVNSFTI